MRTAVLACGFGLGIAVMAALLGVGDVILEQARAPELVGGGDLVVSGLFGSIENTQFVLSTVRDLRLKSGKPSVAAASPSRKASVYLITPDGPDRPDKPDRVVPVVARGGVPSLEKAVGDPEVRGVDAWVDAPGDARWSASNPGDVLRGLDRFHLAPDVPEFAASWAEWLYFNGRTADGRIRFYLTFLVGPATRPGFRSAGVRLQLDRDGQARNFSARADVEEQKVLQGAPDLDIAENHVRLDGERYKISLRLKGEPDGELIGALTLDPAPGRSLPPAVLRGARGWLSGYVVPVLSGRLAGTLTTDGRVLALDGATGYHDHNWGFWRDVRWQWGQVTTGDLSFIYGRVFPPAGVADPDRIPGFLGVLDKQGLIGVATNVSISEERVVGPPGASGAPDAIVVTARGSGLDLRLRFSTDRSIRTPLGITRGAADLDFIQLGGTYHVEGRADGRSIDVTARGAAETFQPSAPH